MPRIRSLNINKIDATNLLEEVYVYSAEKTFCKKYKKFSVARAIECNQYNFW